MTRDSLSRRQFLGNVAGVSAAVAGFPYIVSRMISSDMPVLSARVALCRT